MRPPNFQKQFTLATDSSNFAIGVVLSKEEHPAYLASRTLTNDKRSCSAIDKEFSVILWSINYLILFVAGNFYTTGDNAKIESV